MDSKVVKIGAARPRARTYYERFMEKEGVPVVDGYGVSDVRNLQLKPWKRLGCQGAYLQLRGLEGITGVYVGKLAPGTSTEPERHLYEKVIFILQGEGVDHRLALVEQQDVAGRRSDLRIEQRLDDPDERVRREQRVAVDRDDEVDVVVEQVRDREVERLSLAAVLAEERERDPGLGAELEQPLLDAQEQKGTGVNLTQFEISNNTLIGHLAEWPVGRYHKAHFHGGGAVLVILRSEGYSLMWPNHLGTRPYENGFGDEVVRVDWVPGSVFSPPTNWFHQHFNTGVEPALQLALRCGSLKFPLGIRVAAIRAGVYTSVKQGGTLIEYDDEDPAIRRTYEKELAQKGIAPARNYDAAANDD